MEERQDATTSRCGRPLRRGKPMKFLRHIAPILCTLLAALWVAAPETAETGWTELFDGKTLSGWQVACKPEDRGKAFWGVRDGAITCDSRGRKDHDYVWVVRD